MPQHHGCEYAYSNCISVLCDLSKTCRPPIGSRVQSIAGYCVATYRYAIDLRVRVVATSHGHIVIHKAIRGKVTALGKASENMKRIRARGHTGRFCRRGHPRPITMTAISTPISHRPIGSEGAATNSALHAAVRQGKARQGHSDADGCIPVLGMFASFGGHRCTLNSLAHKDWCPGTAQGHTR